MNRRYFIAGIFFFAAAWVCRMLYARDGAYLDQDGVLHEPFGLIPLAWLFDFAGLVLLVLAWVRRK